MKTALLLIASSLLLPNLALAETAPAVKSKKVLKALSKKKYPKAYNHTKGHVISPFKPYNILDVRHLKPGMLAYDPYTAIVNPATGKLDYTVGKIFRVPEPKKVASPATPIAQ